MKCQHCGDHIVIDRSSNGDFYYRHTVLGYQHEAAPQEGRDE